MTPALRPGDELVVWRPVRSPRVGQVVVYRDRFDDRSRVKRIAAVGADRTLTVRGDNRVLSTAEAELGPVEPDQLAGVAVLVRSSGRGWRRLEYHRDP